MKSDQVATAVFWHLPFEKKIGIEMHKYSGNFKATCQNCHVLP
jgi:hypothetical protein